MLSSTVKTLLSRTFQWSLLDYLITICWNGQSHLYRRCCDFCSLAASTQHRTTGSSLQSSPMSLPLVARRRHSRILRQYSHCFFRRCGRPMPGSECRDAKRISRQPRHVHAADVPCAVAFCSPAATTPAPTTIASLAKTAWRDQRRRCRDILNRKHSFYWHSGIEADLTSP